MNGDIKREIGRINRQAGGATLTKVAREAALAHAFAVWRKELNLQVKSLATVKTAQVAAYVRHALASGKTKRSIQNDLAHIRAGLGAGAFTWGGGAGDSWHQRRTPQGIAGE